MPLVGRILDWVVFLIGVPLLATDVLVWTDTGIWDPMALGGLWQYLAPRSLVFIQVTIEDDISRMAWNPVVVTMLACWAFAAVMAFGLGLVVMCRRRRRDREDGYSILPADNGRGSYRARYLSRSDQRPI